MRLRSSYIAIAIWLLLLLPTGASTKAPGKYFFMVMTDIQFGMYDHNQDLSRESENLKKFVAIANRLHPAFVVNCGDTINRPGDSREIHQFENIISKLDARIPVYNVPGNHDVKNEPTPDSLAAYTSQFGRDHYTFDFRNFEGVVLNSSLIKYPDSAPDEAKQQSEWLESVLRKGKGKNLVIFQHISWFLHDINEPDNYSNLPQTPRKEYFDRFGKAGVRYIFAGHLHDNSLGTEGKIQMRTVGPLGKPLGKAQSGFGVVIVDGDQLKFNYYSLDAPPSEIPM